MVARATGYGVTLLDAQYHIVWANDAFTDLSGYSAAEFIGRKSSELLYFDGTDPETIARIRQAIRSGRGIRFEILVRSKDGHEWWLDSDARPLHDGQGAIKGWVSIQSDVTSEVLKREASRRNESRAQMMIEGGNIGTWEWDARTNLVETNSVFMTTLGYPHDECFHSIDWLRELTHPEDRSECDRSIQDVLEGRRHMVRGHHRLRAKDGSWRWILGAGGVLERGADGIPARIFGVQFDITEQKVADEQRQQRISFLAYHDALTGLANRLGLRSKLEEMLQTSIQTGTSLAVLLIDLDRFKYVNDTLGHDVGDELLVEIARRLTDTVRACDVVARLGGDEFVLVLDGLPDEGHVNAAVQKLFRQLRGNFLLASRTVYTTCSIGISRFPKDGADASTLLKHADLAMYSAKAQGGDSYRLFENAMRPGTDRLSLEVELREALERNELELYYQPRIDTVTGRPTAVEALLRWNHPVRGLVLPGLFIPMAEETGLIESIGQWVMERACQEVRAWLNRGGEPLRVSVNLSPVQFAREELPERVAAALAAATLPAELLELEITETVAMRSPELAARHLARLRALGVSLAIDDFGTGHSSLSRLKLLNVDCVKIDRSLVKDCTADPHDAALCRAAIALGLDLGLEVVAEGVETQEQRQFLAQEHCSTIQGYLLAAPMPAREAFSFVRSLLEVPRLRGALGK
ncbi:MAG: domain S-box protein [Gammaproteobacteria bacterium]|nr:domain S-box protein [Gammaproteobacteria bacterium]